LGDRFLAPRSDYYGIPLRIVKRDGEQHFIRTSDAKLALTKDLGISRKKTLIALSKADWEYQLNIPSTLPDSTLSPIDCQGEGRKVFDDTIAFYRAAMPNRIKWLRHNLALESTVMMRTLVPNIS